VLAFNLRAAEAFAEIVIARVRTGAPISTFDAQIAAIARVRGAAIATRDVRAFEGCGVTLIDPWAG
jgi:predicted nucleic acid-binding protein